MLKNTQNNEHTIEFVQNVEGLHVLDACRRTNPQSKLILTILGLKIEDVNRFRDAGYNQSAEYVWVIT